MMEGTIQKDNGLIEVTLWVLEDSGSCSQF